MSVSFSSQRALMRLCPECLVSRNSRDFERVSLEGGNEDLEGPRSPRLYFGRVSYSVPRWVPRLSKNVTSTSTLVQARGLLFLMSPTTLRRSLVSLSHRAPISWGLQPTPCCSACCCGGGVVLVSVETAHGVSPVGRMQAASTKRGTTSKNRAVPYRELKAPNFSPVRTGRGTQVLTQQPPQHSNHTLAFSQGYPAVPKAAFVASMHISRKNTCLDRFQSASANWVVSALNQARDRK